MAFVDDFIGWNSFFERFYKQISLAGLFESLTEGFDFLRIELACDEYLPKRIDIQKRTSCTVPLRVFGAATRAGPGVQSVDLAAPTKLYTSARQSFARLVEISNVTRSRFDDRHQPFFPKPQTRTDDM